MRSILHSGLAVILVALLASPAAAQDDKSRDEVAWTKRIATEFFEIALRVDDGLGLNASPLAYLSPELVGEIKQKGDNFLHRLASRYPGGRLEIKSAEISPSGSEIILTAELQPLSQEERKKVLDKSQLAMTQDAIADVRVRLTKDNSGRWVIRHIAAKPREK